MANVEITQAERLDQYVTRLVPSVSRAYAVRMIEAGDVAVNGKPQTKAGYKLRGADTVDITYDEISATLIPDIELPVLYEDDDCVVLVKPIGLLTHSKGVFNPEASVASWLHNRLQKELADADTGPNNRAGIVHRLDRATSGVMICAKTAEALTWLQKQFSQRRVHKTYIAVVSGTLKHPEAVIDLPIERDPKKPQTFRVGANGKVATTVYKVLASDEAHSLVELKPQTGRTHQLRVHLAHLGNPIVGDNLYHGEDAERMYLHAMELELTLPSRERRVFSAPLPTGFQEIISG
ncbi:MAG: RluA family pseudouridine synthase [Candidatus Saccharimonadales bacterium]